MYTDINTKYYCILIIHTDKCWSCSPNVHKIYYIGRFFCDHLPKVTKIDHKYKIPGTKAMQGRGTEVAARIRMGIAFIHSTKTESNCTIRE